jgi:hypothetical protein
MIRIANKASEVLSREQMEQCSVFMNDNAKRLFQSDGSEVVYVYSDKFFMPVCIIKKLIFRYCQFLDSPFCRNESIEESEKEFLDEVIMFLKKSKGIHWLLETPVYSFFSNYPTNAKHIPFGSHVVDLSLEEDSLFANVHSKHRNVIKKAQKDGVVIEKGNSGKFIDEYAKMDVDTWKRSNRASSGKSAIANQMECLGDNAVIYLAYLDGEVQSGALYYYNDQMCYYMHGANKNNPHNGAGNLLQWQAMLDMKANGVKRFSFVGCRINEDENSKYHGIQRFKERFGGELVQGYMFKKTLNPSMWFLFDLINKVRNLMKCGKFQGKQDIIDSEIYKWPQQ